MKVFFIKVSVLSGSVIGKKKKTTTMASSKKKRVDEMETVDGDDSDNNEDIEDDMESDDENGLTGNEVHLNFFILFSILPSKHLSLLWCNS